MVVKIADNILSPLGDTTLANYRAVKAGRSQLKHYPHLWGLPEPCVASIIDRESLPPAPGHTTFETLAITSAANALAQCSVDPAAPNVLFVLSTTKGNVHLLDTRADSFDRSRVMLGAAAQIIASHFRNPNTPLVVSNACTSGISALIVASRLLKQGTYDYAVVVGADIQSPFIISGFQSFKALSPEPCRPFDAHRMGLNLGEAAATMVLARVDSPAPSQWQLVCGAIRNDANHISGPSRVGEGSYQALAALMAHTTPDELAFINAHGTATLYNDEMESIAITRAGLQHLPVNSLKGCYGHTMGAAGVLEALVSMCAVDDHTVLPTRGFETLGVSNPLCVTSRPSATTRRAFIKLLSGFGGCNAAMLFRKEADK